MVHIQSYRSSSKSLTVFLKYRLPTYDLTSQTPCILSCNQFFCLITLCLIYQAIKDMNSDALNKFEGNAFTFSYQLRYQEHYHYHFTEYFKVFQSIAKWIYQLLYSLTLKTLLLSTLNT